MRIVKEMKDQSAEVRTGSGENLDNPPQPPGEAKAAVAGEETGKLRIEKNDLEPPEKKEDNNGAPPFLSRGPLLVPIKRSPSDSSNGRWSKEEDALLRKAVDILGAKNWKRVSAEFLKGARTDVQCLHRWQKVLKPGLVKGPWTKEEDETIIKCRMNGITKWSEIAQHVTGRIGKQCRERWFNHLDPDIRRCEWTEEEDRKLIEGQALLGNKWTQIAKLFLPGRPENAVKNRWNAATRRRIGTKKKVQIDNNSRNRFLSDSADPDRVDLKKMRPFTKTQARFRQIRPTQDFKDLGNAMDGMVDLAMTGFVYQPEEEEEEKPKRIGRKRRSANTTQKPKELDDSAVDTLTSLMDSSSKKSKRGSFQESRPGLSPPAELNVKSESSSSEPSTPTLKTKPSDISLSPTKKSKKSLEKHQDMTQHEESKEGTKKVQSEKSSGKDKKNGKLKEYFKSEEMVQMNESVPQLVI